MEKELTCIIADDEPLALQLIKSYVEKTPRLKLENTFSSSADAFFYMQQNKPNIAFLDIQMPDIDGISLAESIKESHTKVIFITAFPQYALQGYKVNAVDYLLKPVSYKDFLESVAKVSKLFENNNTNPLPDNIFLKCDYKLVRVKLNDILYLEGLKDYVKVYLSGESEPLIATLTMAGAESNLPKENFIRIHKSFIINRERIESIEKGRICIKGTYLPISDTYKDNLMKAINVIKK